MINVKHASNSDYTRHWFWGSILVAVFLFPGTALALSSYVGDMGSHFYCAASGGTYVQHGCQP